MLPSSAPCWRGGPGPASATSSSARPCSSSASIRSAPWPPSRTARSIRSSTVRIASWCATGRPGRGIPATPSAVRGCGSTAVPAGPASSVAIPSASRRRSGSRTTARDARSDRRPDSMGSVEDLLSWGVFLRFAAIGTYAAAFVSYAGRLAIQKLKLDRAATALAVLGVATHTAYLVTRWIAAGQIEILSREKSGDVLSSMDRFWFMVSHPPYTNLFDALNFVAWAMMVCYLIIERKWGLRVVGVLAVALALVAMGEASLVADKQIEPLVAALQSYWILIHVGMLFVAYSLFTLGAVCALLYLVRTGTPTAVLGGVQAAAAALLLALIGGTRLLFGATYEMAPGWQPQIQSRLHPGKLPDAPAAAHVLPAGMDKPVKLFTPVAGVGPFLLLAILLLAAGAVVYYRVRKGPEQGIHGLGYKLVAAGFALLTLGLALLVYRIVASPEIALPAGVRLAPG